MTRLLLLCLLASCGSTARTTALSPPPASSPDPLPPVVVTAPVMPAPVTPAAGSLGTLRFEVTGGNPAARRDFEQGVLAMHSFWYTEATRRFTAAIAADPSFAMAHWGLAMSHAQLLFGIDDLDAGRAALANVPPLDNVTPRERAWIASARAFFAPEQIEARRTALVTALARMHREYPDDDEVASFLALGLMSGGPPGQPPELALQVRGGALALEVLARQPTHPGAAHYVIHAFDTPDLARIALPAAKQYAAIAPGAFHARHMPAHIFARLGDWEAARASCQSAWDISLAERVADFHSLSWIVAINFELGRRADAEAAIKRFGDAVRKGAPSYVRGGYTEVVSVYLEATRDDARLDELLAPLQGPVVETADMPKGPGAPPFAVFEQIGTMSLRAGVSARRGDLAAVRKAARERAALDRKLDPFLELQLGKAGFAKDKTKRQRQAELGDQLALARARKDHEATVPLYRKLVAHVESEPHHEPSVTGGSPREGLAEALMEIGKPREALVELELLLKRHPRRARLLLRAARAAARTGDAVRAYDHYAQLVEVWHAADASFPGLDEAVAAVAAGRPKPPPASPPAKPAPPAGTHHH